MQNTSSNIGFVIWGVRNGFEIILSSRPADSDFLKNDVITDNMRQICNVAPKRFFSLHKNYKFTSVTLYHTDAKDIVGRNAYIAITFYLPATHRFVGNVMASLHGTMDFYLQKQGNSNVNMFTEDMIREQFSALNATASGEGISYGNKLGYHFYQAELDIEDRVARAEVDGYKAVFFLPPGNNDVPQQLTGYENITVFHKTYSISFLGFNPEAHSVYYNNKIVAGVAGEFKIHGFAGEQVTLIENKSDRRRTFTISQQDQKHHIWSVFPVRNQQEHSPSNHHRSKHTQKGFSNLYKVLLVAGLLLLVFLAIWYSNDIGTNDSGGLNNEVTENNSDSSVSNVNTIEVNKNTPVVKDSNKVIYDTFPVTEIYHLNKLNKVERGKLTAATSVKGLISIKLNNNGDSVFIKTTLTNKDSLVIIKKLLGDKLLTKKVENKATQKDRKGSSGGTNNNNGTGRAYE